MLDAPDISITISTIDGWPGFADNLRDYERATERANGELIVTDGSDNPPPPDGALGPRTQWHQEPGASVYKMRVTGYRLSRAPIVAISEDHCRVTEDWGVRLIAALDAAPEAVAVGGSVENGATGSTLDWASYFVVQAAMVPPIKSGPVPKIAGAVNVAYRREALEALDDFDGLGTLDGLHQRQLRKHGATLVADDSIRVVHDQSKAFAEATVMHFHAGRTFAGFLRHRMDGLAWFRLLAVGLVPWARLTRAVRIGVGRGHRKTIVRAWPVMLWLLYAQAIGHIVGFALGPGDSPRKVP
jgi:hypothetical protein